MNYSNKMEEDNIPTKSELKKILKDSDFLKNNNKKKIDKQLENSINELKNTLKNELGKLSHLNQNNQNSFITSEKSVDNTLNLDEENRKIEKEKDQLLNEILENKKTVRKFRKILRDKNSKEDSDASIAVTKEDDLIDSINKVNDFDESENFDTETFEFDNINNVDDKKIVKNENIDDDKEKGRNYTNSENIVDWIEKKDKEYDSKTPEDFFELNKENSINSTYENSRFAEKEIQDKRIKLRKNRFLEKEENTFDSKLDLIHDEYDQKLNKISNQINKSYEDLNQNKLERKYDSDTTNDKDYLNYLASKEIQLKVSEFKESYDKKINKLEKVLEIERSKKSKQVIPEGYLSPEEASSELNRFKSIYQQRIKSLEERLKDLEKENEDTTIEFKIPEKSNISDKIVDDINRFKNEYDRKINDLELDVESSKKIGLDIDTEDFNLDYSAYKLEKENKNNIKELEKEIDSKLEKLSSKIEIDEEELISKAKIEKSNGIENENKTKDSKENDEKVKILRLEKNLRNSEKKLKEKELELSKISNELNEKNNNSKVDDFDLEKKLNSFKDEVNSLKRINRRLKKKNNKLQKDKYSSKEQDSDLDSMNLSKDSYSSEQLSEQNPIESYTEKKDNILIYDEMIDQHIKDEVEKTIELDYGHLHSDNDIKNIKDDLYARIRNDLQEELHIIRDDVKSVKEKIINIKDDFIGEDQNYNNSFVDKIDKEQKEEIKISKPPTKSVRKKVQKTHEELRKEFLDKNSKSLMKAFGGRGNFKKIVETKDSLWIEIKYRDKNRFDMELLNDLILSPKFMEDNIIRLMTGDETLWYKYFLINKMPKLSNK